MTSKSEDRAVEELDKRDEGQTATSKPAKDSINLGPVQKDLENDEDEEPEGVDELYQVENIEDYGI